jgi:GTPase
MKIHEQEIEEGNIEYKRFFENITLNKLAHLTAQMNWRINEGNGYAHYYLGICDNGTICKDLTQERLDYSLDVIKAMVEGCNAYIESTTINRIDTYLWLDIRVKRMVEYIPEYRILCTPSTMKTIHDYIKMGNTSYYTFYHNNEKFLFFESDIPNITELIDFNLILPEMVLTNICEQRHLKTAKPFILASPNNVRALFWSANIRKPTLVISNGDGHIYDSIDYISTYMKGNIIPNKKNIIFNIIERHNVPSIGIILYGFLKDGYIEKGSIINNEWKVYSIHYNMKDCKNIIAPAIISIRVESIF